MKIRARSACLVAGLMIVTAAIAPAFAANVNVAPTRTIAGSNTGFGLAIDVVRDSTGRAYVSDFTNSSVSVFGPHATGNVGPSRLIKGANTLLAHPEGVVLDSNGFLYVANVDNRLVTEYARGASGNVAPANSFDTGTAAFAIALDRGGNIYVTDGGLGVRVFAPSATGTPTPLRTITGPTTKITNAIGLAVDRAGRIWVANGSDGSVLVFSKTANGDALPVRTIKGPSTTLSLPRGVATDDRGRAYVTDFTTKTVDVFGPHANGDVAPVRTLGGAATGLNGPWGISLNKKRGLFVVNESVGSLTQYKPLFPAAKASKVRGLKVKGAPGARKRTVGWKKPASNGDATITGYKVVVKKGSHVLFSKLVAASRHKVKVSRSKLRNGRNTVIVRAKNSQGLGKKASKSFVVRK